MRSSSVGPSDFYIRKTLSSNTRSLDDGDLEYYSDKNRHRANRLLNDVYDDNDIIQKRSRKADAQLLNKITDKLSELQQPVNSRPPAYRRTAHNMFAVCAPPPPAQSPVVRHMINTGRAVSVPPQAYVSNTYTSTGVPTYSSPLFRRPVVHTGVHVPVTRSRHVITTSQGRYPIAQRRDIEALMDYDLPDTSNSLKIMRNRLSDVKDGMSYQRQMLDRYLPLDLGPPEEVDGVVNRKYWELAERIPYLEPDGRVPLSVYQNNYVDTGYGTTRLRSQSVGPVGHESNRPVSDLRGRIRKLICKTKKDPAYYN